MNTDELINQINAISSAEDMARVDALIRAEPGQMHPDVQNALLEKLKEFTASSKAAREDIISTLKLNGVEYPLSDWLTPNNYAKQFGIENVATVINWISRGIIPAENIKDIPELGLRLVKAVEYKPRNYERVAARLKDA